VFALQTAKDGIIESETKRHCMTSLMPANEMNDVTRDVRTRDSKCTSADVTGASGLRREIAVCHFFITY